MKRAMPAGDDPGHGRQLLSVVTALLTWFALARRLRAGRAAPTDETHGAACRVLCAYGLHSTLSVGWVSRLVDRACGVPGAARLLMDCTLVASNWFHYPLLPQVVGPVAGSPVNRRGVLGSAPLVIGTGATLIACFGMARRAEVARSGHADPAASNWQHPAALAYGLVQATYGGAMMARGFVISRRVERNLSGQTASLARWRIHTRLQSIGYGLAVLYMAHDALRAIVRYLDVPYPERQAMLAAAAARMIGSALIMNKMLPNLPRWGMDYRAYRQLHPLWRDLHRADPRWVLGSLFRPRWAAWDDALAVNDIALRLERRTTEIRDGLRELGPYCAAGTDDEAVVHPEQVATVIIEALRARGAGQLATCPLATPLLRQTASPSEEVAYLRRIAEAYNRSRGAQRCAPPKKAQGNVSRASGIFGRVRVRLLLGRLWRRMNGVAPSPSTS